MFNYEQLTLRNSGYISSELQEKIRSTKLLIAGCGIGSTIAQAAVRIGFENFILADGDQVDLHNLNRQAFNYVDIGKQKVIALEENLKSINPLLSIQIFDGWINKNVSKELVASSDFVIDTIDFLDLAGITALHDEAHNQNKPIISSLSAGWGAIALYFPMNSPFTFRQLIGLPLSGSVENASYVKHFTALLQSIENNLLLPREVVSVMQTALTILEDGKPCPASQISVGAHAIAALTTTAIIRVLAGLPVATAPNLIITDNWSAAFDKCVSLNLDLATKS